VRKEQMADPTMLDEPFIVSNSSKNEQALDSSELCVADSSRYLILLYLLVAYQ
jgi:hypothetical protein